jgi:hypothetical protein
MQPRPSPQVKRAVWQLLAFVRTTIKHGMDTTVFSATRPAQLHDELRQFLDAYDPDSKYEPKKR